MDNSSEISGSNPSTTLSTPGSSSDAAPLNMSLDILERYLDDVLCSLSDKGLRCKLLDSGMKLRDVVQPVASDFSKLFEGISEGAKNIWDQKSSSSKISSEAQSAAFEAVKGVGNIQLAGVGLLAIATVLERIDKISANDRDCMDLLKVMLDLAKFLKQLKDMNADSHKEISEKMTEALHLIVTGSILCRSFVGYKKLLKFLFTAKLRDELVYMRRKVDTAIGQLSLQMQVKIASFYMSRQAAYCDVAGGIPSEQSTGDTEIIHSRPGGISSEQLTGDNEIVHLGPGGISSEQSTGDNEIVHSGGINPVYSDIDHQESQIRESYVIEDVSSNHGRSVEEAQPTGTLSRKSLSLRRYLKKITPRKFLTWHKSGHTVFEIKLYKSQLSSFNEIQRCLGGFPIHFTVDQLKKATCGFSDLNTITEVDASHVYKGILHNGRQAMVKTFCDTESEMLKELAFMLKLSHKNILKLLGSCITEKQLMLIYDYMSNKNLSYFLFDDLKERQVLDWPMRSNIILGVTSALAYLHEGLDERMCCIHRDIKPSNVFLDDNFNAKIYGFGSAKISAHVDDWFDSRTFGTVGYLAPEYLADGRRLSSKIDIYSFGVLVLVVVSGRKAIGDSKYEEDEIHVVDRAMRLSKEDRLDELIDPRLLKTQGFNSNSILRTIRIALSCVERDPELRPSASRVLAMLSSEEESPAPSVYKSISFVEGQSSTQNMRTASMDGTLVDYLEELDDRVGEIEEATHQL